MLDFSFVCALLPLTGSSDKSWKMLALTVILDIYKQQDWYVFWNYRVNFQYPLMCMVEQKPQQPARVQRGHRIQGKPQQWVYDMPGIFTSIDEVYQLTDEPSEQQRALADIWAVFPVFSGQMGMFARSERMQRLYVLLFKDILDFYQICLKFFSMSSKHDMRTDGDAFTKQENTDFNQVLNFLDEVIN